ncbi:TlpA family protein disulfide reductase [Candidatus Gottesmanbacteria bacterium]|nr:TlpA family protein disulfide reductase [Candidatus Gottesmanbacteria bacterium]
MPKKLLLIITLGIIILGLFSLLKNLSLSNKQNITKSFSEAETAPNFSLPDYQGKIVNLSDFSKQPLVINSWAGWCPYCKKELVDFAKVQEELKNKIIIIAIDRAESLAVAKKYSDELGVSNSLVFLLDPADSFYEAIGGFSMPETIFVDKDKIVRDHKRGPMDKTEIKNRIKTALSVE